MGEITGGRPPDDDAFGRVTNAERYRALHEAARLLIDQLTTDYVAERTDGAALLSSYASAWPDADATTLTPATGAPLTFGFTPFPGLVVRFGFCGEASFPSCGCDGCDEDPADEARRMAELVGVVVAGGLSESRLARMEGPDWYDSKLCDETGCSSQRRSLPDFPGAEELPLDTTDWEPWTRREPID